MEMLSDASSTLAISTIEIKNRPKGLFFISINGMRESNSTSMSVKRATPVERRAGHGPGDRKGEASGGRLRSRMWAEPSPPRTKKSCPGRVGAFSVPMRCMAQSTGRGGVGRQTEKQDADLALSIIDSRWAGHFTSPMKQK